MTGDSGLTARNTIQDEGTRQRYELTEMADTIPDVITLGRGDPDLPTPAFIVEAAKRAIVEGVVDAPSDPAGMPELRRSIAAKLQRDNDVVVEPEGGVVVTTGSQEALFLTVQALLEPGDDILVIDPRYTSYDVAIRTAGANLVEVQTEESSGFAIDPEEVERSVTNRTRALLIISPNNPTAATADLATLEALASLAHKYNFTVISDEIYELLMYDGVRHVSAAAVPGMADRTVTINGFSKAFCMTGWRVGYTAGPEHVMRRVRDLKSIMSRSAPTVSQIAAAAALEGGAQAIRSLRETYAVRRRIVLDALDGLGLHYSNPTGGFYVFLNTGPTGVPALTLSERLLREYHVLAFPGTGFGRNWGQYMRLSWLQPEDKLRQAMDRLQQCLREM